MKRGFTKAWRKELESGIWMMPPIYHRIWYWVRLKAQHELYLFPTRKLFGIWVLPGQRLTSIQEIANGVKYMDNHREIIPDKRVVVRVLDWLEFNGNIDVTCNTFGTIITVINWDIYNANNTEPVTLDVQGDAPRYVHKKRMIKNEKEVKPKWPHFPNADEVFKKCWDEYPKVRRIGEEKAKVNFIKACPTVEVARNFFMAILNYKEEVEGKEPHYILHAHRFFNLDNWKGYYHAE